MTIYNAFYYFSIEARDSRRAHNIIYLN